MNKSNLYLVLTLLLLIVLSSCEYDRIAVESECSNIENLFTIDSTNSVLAIDCGNNNGELVLRSRTNEANVLFSINEAPFKAQAVYTELGAGSYKITAKLTDTGCISESVKVDIVNINGLGLQLVSSSNTSCGVENGNIIVAQTNGTAPIRYQLNNGGFQDSPNFQNLKSGSYNVIAVDANGCEASLNDLKITTDVSFALDIKPIIATNCAVTGCHSGSQPPNFTDNQNIFNNASRIRSRTSSGSMPPSSRADLSQEEINLISCWVADGALNN